MSRDFIDLNDKRDIPRSVTEDMVNLLCGDEIGRGVDRIVYACRFNPNWVVKVEPWDNEQFANALEWRIWDQVKNSDKLKKYFAPIHHISPNGLCMIMERCQPIPKEITTVELPSFCCDVQYANLGLYNGQIVLVDYDRHSVTDNARIKKFKITE